MDASAFDPAKADQYPSLVDVPMSLTDPYWDQFRRDVFGHAEPIVRLQCPVYHSQIGAQRMMFVYGTLGLTPLPHRVWMNTNGPTVNAQIGQVA